MPTVAFSGVIVMFPRRTASTLFPYTTLFRSIFNGGFGRDATTTGGGAGVVVSSGGTASGTTLKGGFESIRSGGTGIATVVRGRKSTRLNSSHSSISYAVISVNKDRVFAGDDANRCVLWCHCHVSAPHCIHTLSLHDALPIYLQRGLRARRDDHWRWCWGGCLIRWHRERDDSQRGL